ncbi:MAG TPA: T3SS effector HopA1 family protein, partial [Thermoanaerobaculia bacterium]
ENGAVPLVRAVTTLLNRYQIPFRFKTLSYSGVYTRADAAVLFFAARYFDVITKLLPAIRAEIAPYLRPAVPLMTKRLHDGIGLAEDPATGESFGMSRSQLLAQAIWDAYTRGAQSEESRMQELAIQFQRNGLSLDRPHLRAASADIYEVAA